MTQGSETGVTTQPEMMVNSSFTLAGENTRLIRQRACHGGSRATTERSPATLTSRLRRNGGNTSGPGHRPIAGCRHDGSHAGARPSPATLKSRRRGKGGRTRGLGHRRFAGCPSWSAQAGQPRLRPRRCGFASSHGFADDRRARSVRQQHRAFGTVS